MAQLSSLNAPSHQSHSKPLLFAQQNLSHPVPLNQVLLLLPRVSRLSPSFFVFGLLAELHHLPKYRAQLLIVRLSDQGLLELVLLGEDIAHQ